MATNQSASSNINASHQQPTILNIACWSLSVKQNPTVLRMSPPATVRNWKFHKPLLAVGANCGTIQIFDLSSGKLYRELAVHNYPVIGIEWIGLNAFLSYAVSKSSHDNKINWDLSVTELDTGRTIILKSGQSGDSSVIQSVKTSHLRQYFIVIYKNQPFEIWDLETLSLIRRVPRKFSSIVAAEWSPLYSKKFDSASSNDPKRSSPAPLRENFVVTNKLGVSYHFSIAGNVLKEITEMPPESTMNKSVTSIAWKSDHVILGQMNGDISVWDLEQKRSRGMRTMRGPIRKIRFAPGKGNMKILLLFDDGVDIWDAKRLRLVSTVSTSRIQSLKITDADWASSDRPVILTSNGLALVTNIELKHFAAKTRELLSGNEPESQFKSTSEVGNVTRSSEETCYLQ